jgi:tetratricopeptide (TPR) repeat protein
LDKATEAFAAMIEIDPLCFRGYLNLSFVFHAANRVADSERAARKALELQKSDLRARFLLGASLAAQNRNIDEALDNLRASAPEFPDAHLEISRILMEKGEFDSAMESLQTFTKSSKALGGVPGNSLLSK